MLATVRYARALILSSYHVLYLHNTSINQTLTTRIPVYNLLDKYRIKLLKNPKLDTRLRGMALAGHNLIWPRSSLRTSRKRAERSLRSVTWPRTRARVSLGRLLSVQFFPSPLPPSPITSPFVSLPPSPFLSPARSSTTRRPVISIAVRCRYLHNLMDSISGAGWRGEGLLWNGFYFLPSRCVRRPI